MHLCLLPAVVIAALVVFGFLARIRRQTSVGGGRHCILYKSTTVRAYSFSISGQQHFCRVPVHRYPINRGLDVALLPWATLDEATVHYADVTVQRNRGMYPSVRYRAYYSQGGEVEPNLAVAASFPDLQWNGHFVIFRCACSSHDRFVDMRQGDDSASKIVLHRLLTNGLAELALLNGIDA
ncbi:hypothetical protein EVJ58_g6880 [Rhodofomes roseus]|uniref:Uncharacterized protein n=1 Tax=Rhodofomes roseus TaxID=34475 RepID=A0A4Y9YA18_9APHY|nr:hypothetical protein EVJ58_g6880 [Rhodofomes roseus]